MTSDTHTTETGISTREENQLSTRCEHEVHKDHRVQTVAVVTVGPHHRQGHENNMRDGRVSVTQTCRRRFVSLCGLAGTSSAHGVDSRHTEAIVNVSMELQHGRAVVPRHSEQLLPVSRLPLGLLIVYNELC